MDPGIWLCYDGGCYFCSNFALATELRGGVPSLHLVDARRDKGLACALAARGCPISSGAVLVESPDGPAVETRPPGTTGCDTTTLVPPTLTPVLLDGMTLSHGADAIARLCTLMRPSDPLLLLLARLFRVRPRARRLYPLLLLARRVALALRGLPLDPLGSDALAAR
ncbi:MAG: hypothetical protein ERJ67_01300 [Aphanocapsa feldmannii 277cV]|uniref:DUF393 domain-containing protein n=2 Tax=Aphanocapsa feldmannii TaxID=192050 RepID=A0A524RQT7_9CHRO|nr:MAG: hypothetical protein ERJ67_01300 [Aphanocapsa feldmannii 277cV]TGH21330.1 MAG: hypothetical protein ERJ68_05580 [Aphanocapsa feldmannii 277cI]